MKKRKKVLKRKLKSVTEKTSKRFSIIKDLHGRERKIITICNEEITDLIIGDFLLHQGILEIYVGFASNMGNKTLWFLDETNKGITYCPGITKKEKFISQGFQVIA